MGIIMHRNTRIRQIRIMLLCIVCTGCSNTPENVVYKESYMLPDLIIPSGLDRPVKSEVMAIPDKDMSLGEKDLPLSELLLPPVFIPEEGAESQSEPELPEEMKP